MPDSVRTHGDTVAMNSDNPTTPKPVCPLCLNKAFILINAGTGLMKKCPAKCKPITILKP